MKAFMWLPVVILGALLLFGSDIGDFVKLKRVQYASYQKATSASPDNFVVIDGMVYDKKGRKQ
jgi:hypothetical protein